ncbi:ArnT family glycosyltransferase [Nannocystis bainbridge]|uniref:Glycosyltransferase RgtA/B/C/D-like domain-containing protein n=1 Tax=Nannocystis bainbridge TaxID=2995303 RepID=A0ABT5E9H6_9BACT|nr:hypothetical protein [Nannocystis bainbridge]MDC0722265.1 hypothetical protein [Nannocystis bainbridge]
MTPRATRRLTIAAALALGLAVVLLLARGHRDVGYVRDEGIYFHASRAYADWAVRGLQSPSVLFDRPARDRAFAVNHEHPALMKLAGGLSARLFSAPGPGGQPPETRAQPGLAPIMPEGAAMRLPAQLLAGLGVVLLFLAGAGLTRKRPVLGDSPLSAPPASPRPATPVTDLSPGTSSPREPNLSPETSSPRATDLSPETSSTLGSSRVFATGTAPAADPSPGTSSPREPNLSPGTSSPSDLSPETSALSPLIPAVLAALWFIGLPHVWFHAGLHCFDVPVAVLTLAVVLCYRRALASWRWSLLLGPLLGVAISVKHNALFIPVLLGVHYLACLALARRRPSRGQLLPLPFLSMALLAPPTVLALWPWLWSDPLARLGEYLEFHRLHAYYNTEYFSINYNQPPLPWSYPFVLTWATVPTALLLLAAIGLVLAVRSDLSSRPSADLCPARFTAPLRGHPARDGLLWALFGLFPLLLISLPTIPIFGGTKHWITAYPFLALAAAFAYVTLWRSLALTGRARHLPAALLPLLLVPALWSTLHGHPYNLSQYAPLAGGARGAADLGLMRGFWGSAVLPLLDDLSERPGPLHLHDLHELARLQYEREGRWPPGTTSAPLTRARAALLFHERHMLSNEVDAWNHFQNSAPLDVITLDDVPLTSLYAGSK